MEDISQFLATVDLPSWKKPRLTADCKCFVGRIAGLQQENDGDPSGGQPVA